MVQCHQKGSNQWLKPYKDLLSKAVSLWYYVAIYGTKYLNTISLIYKSKCRWAKYLTVSWEGNIHYKIHDLHVHMLMHVCNVRIIVDCTYKNS